MTGFLKRMTKASQWIVLAAGLLGLAGTCRADDVVFIGWSQTEVGLKPTLEKLFRDFQARNAGDKLQVIGFPFGQMEQNLILRRRNDQRMDVAQLQERWLPEFVQMKALYDINAVVGANALQASFDPDLLKLGQVDGKQYAVPFTAGAITLVANRNVLQAAGI
jgi:multiple sugar transport system substrate-binding protein